jgi:hypothetical protein
MRAKDLFPDGIDGIQVGDTYVRKGSIAAFIYNALALEQLDSSSEPYQQAAAEMREITPMLRAIRFFEVFNLRLHRAAQIVLEIDPNLLGQDETPEQSSTNSRCGRTGARDATGGGGRNRPLPDR